MHQLRFSLALLVVTGCGCCHSGLDIDPGPYTQEIIEQALEMFEVTAKRREGRADWRQDIEDYGLHISFTETVDCPNHPKGCVADHWPDHWLEMQVQSQGECIALTALPHELTHTLGYLYSEPDTTHSEDGMWYFNDRKCSVEWEAEQRMREALCPGTAIYSYCAP